MPLRSADFILPDVNKDFIIGLRAAGQLDLANLRLISTEIKIILITIVTGVYSVVLWTSS